ncbi:hypothetical protein EVAR_94536_1 [Eumeta japonica]|uniref:Uncharacterized protein n=1 Tax=Eumeta variegata TaxID=151549 RepID=A0A4C1UW27_EUMVA|nr:hypothetical protein EVAR_94536_1 [Eumeta japonica]
MKPSSSFSVYSTVGAAAPGALPRRLRVIAENATKSVTVGNRTIYRSLGTLCAVMAAVKPQKTVIDDETEALEEMERERRSANGGIKKKIEEILFFGFCSVVTIASLIQSTIKKQIKDTDFMATIIDKTSAVSIRDQLVATLRYFVDSKVVDRFITHVDVGGGIGTVTYARLERSGRGLREFFRTRYLVLSAEARAARARFTAGPNFPNYVPRPNLKHESRTAPRRRLTRPKQKLTINCGGAAAAPAPAPALAAI